MPQAYISPLLHSCWIRTVCTFSRARTRFMDYFLVSYDSQHCLFVVLSFIQELLLMNRVLSATSTWNWRHVMVTDTTNSFHILSSPLCLTIRCSFITYLEIPFALHSNTLRAGCCDPPSLNPFNIHAMYIFWRFALVNKWLALHRIDYAFPIHAFPSHRRA